MDFPQETRRVRLVTALGEGALGIRRVRVTEALSTPFEMEIEALSGTPDLDFDTLLGRGVTVAMESRDGVEPRHFSGLVTEAEFLGLRERHYGVRIKAAPWLWFLGLQQTCRIFEDKSAPEIIEQVFKENGASDFQIKISKTYPKYEYCVQYNETDLNFVSRLMEHEGIYYYFKHGNPVTNLVLIDTIADHEALPGYDSIPFEQSGHMGALQEEGVQSWSQARRVRPTAAMLRDFDHADPYADLAAQTQISAKHGMAGARVYEYPGRYVIVGDGNKLATTRLQELRTRAATAEGEATARGIGAGFRFRLTDHPVRAYQGEHLVIAARHEITAPSYETSTDEGEDYRVRFEAIPTSETFRPPRRAPKPRIAGPQTAIVTGKGGGDIDVDAQGRVLVSFHWLPGVQSRRTRVAQVWTGAKFGAISIPRVGEEVVVAFEGGDPDRPLIVGSVYNGKAEPPYPLPDDATVTAFKTNSSKGGEGFNEIRLQDKKGEENFFIHAEKDFDQRTKNIAREWVGVDRHAMVAKNEFLEVGENRHETVGKESYRKIAKDSHEQVDGSRFAAVKMDEHLDAGMGVFVNAGMDANLKAGLNILVEGGLNVVTNAGINHHVKAGVNAVIEANTGITLKVGGNFIAINSGGIFIQGSTVMINSGGAPVPGPGTKPKKAKKAKAAKQPVEPETQKPGAKPPPGLSKPLKPTSFQIERSAPASALRKARAAAAPFAAV